MSSGSTTSTTTSPATCVCGCGAAVYKHKKNISLLHNIVTLLTLPENLKHGCYVTQIYNWIEKNSPCMRRTLGTNWRNSIRHTLSFKPEFVKKQDWQ